MLYLHTKLRGSFGCGASVEVDNVFSTGIELIWGDNLIITLKHIMAIPDKGVVMAGVGRPTAVVHNCLQLVVSVLQGQIEVILYDVSVHRLPSMPL